MRTPPRRRPRSGPPGRPRRLVTLVAAAVAAATVPLVAAPAHAARPTTQDLVVEKTTYTKACDTRKPDECSEKGPTTTTETPPVRVTVPGGGSVSIEHIASDRRDIDDSGDRGYRGCGKEPWEYHSHGEFRKFVLVVRNAEGAEVARQEAPWSYYVGESVDTGTYYYSNHVSGNACEGPYDTTYISRSDAQPRLRTGPPPLIDCGGGRVLTPAQVDQLVVEARNNGATPEQVADLDQNPCEVLAGLQDGLEVQEPLLLASTQFERTFDGHVCGTLHYRLPFKFRYGGWRGWPFGNVDLDDTVAHIDVRQYLCKDQFGVVLDNGSAVDYSVPSQPKATPPPSPEVNVNVFGFTWLMAISKGGPGGGGVSSAYWVEHNSSPKAGWRVTIELELTLLGAGGGGGFAAWKKVYQRTLLYTVDDIPNI